MADHGGNETGTPGHEGCRNPERDGAITRTTRREFLIATSGAAAAASLPAVAFAGEGKYAGADLGRLIDEERRQIRATMAEEGISGGAICLIYDGKPVWVEGFGVIHAGSDQPVGPETIFSIQSTSKNMTATAVMIAVQRGLLDLDAPITRYVPDFTVGSRFEPRPQERITLRHLLANRGGFTHQAPVGNDDDLGFPSFEEHVRSISATWLRFPVGERFRYSNLGFDLAAFILQRLMKKPFAECVKHLLFDPLGMSDTTADTETYMQRADRALGHVDGYETVPRALPFIGAGGVYASAQDLGRYLSFHLNNGRHGPRTVLEQRGWNEMHAFPFGGGYSLGVAGWPARFGDTRVALRMHNGGGCGFGCVFRFYPGEGLGVAALFNRPSGKAYRWGGPVLDKMLERRHGPKRPTVEIEDFPQVTLPESELRKYVGHWLGNEAPTQIRIEQGRLVAKRGSNDFATRPIASSRLAMANAGPGGEAVQMNYFAPRDGMPAHLESVFSYGHLDYNDGPDDPKGPDKPEWDKYLGTYWTRFWKKRAQDVVVRRKNGWLYLDEIRLVTEHEPGLFFTSDGEAVDFRRDPATWKSLPLRRA